MAGEGAPAADLAGIVVVPAAKEIAAIPLKPAARIIRVDPTLTLPFGQGLA